LIASCWKRPGRTAELPLRILADPADATRVDWVLLCTKGHQVPSAARWLARLCDVATRVAVLQNGIGHVAASDRWSTARK